MNKLSQPRNKFFCLFVLILSLTTAAFGQTTAFTYQGRLTDAAAQSAGTYDFQFALFDAETGGAQQGATQTSSGVVVANGVFSVRLDFGAAAFSGAERFLEIKVKKSTDSDFVTLAPRQRITSAPTAIRSLSAASADTANAAVNAETLDNLDSSSFVQTDSTAFVRNQTSQQTADFNVSGTGKADVFDAVSNYKIAGNRVFSVNAQYGDLLAGFDAGKISYGSLNTFVGSRAGFRNTDGYDNSFFGVNSGYSNTSSRSNSFFGSSAGDDNVSGSYNSFFGRSAGNNNSTGSYNTAVGTGAGFSTGNLQYATAVGANAQATASDTVVIGKTAGTYNVNGINVARPADTVQIAGNQVVYGRLNVMNGAASTVAFGDLNVQAGAGNADFYMQGAGAARGINFGVNSQTTNATLYISQYDGTTYQDRLFINPNGAIAITTLGAAGSTALCRNNFNEISGCSATGGQFILNQTTAQASADFNIGGSGKANSFDAATQYNIGGERVLSVAGGGNLFAGVDAGNVNTGGDNTFVGKGAGLNNTTGDSNSFFGMEAAKSNSTGDSNAMFGKSSGLLNTSGSRNAFFGYAAGLSNGAGNYNTMLGYFADAVAGNFSFATALGSHARATANDTIVIGKTAGTYGNVARPADTVQIPGNQIVSGKINVATLGAAGSVRLCRNASNEISTCTANAALVEDENQSQKTELLLETVKEQQRQIDELKQIVCSLKPDAAVCRK